MISSNPSTVFSTKPASCDKTNDQPTSINTNTDKSDPVKIVSTDGIFNVVDNVHTKHDDDKTETTTVSSVSLTFSDRLSSFGGGEDDNATTDPTSVALVVVPPSLPRRGSVETKDVSVDSTLSSDDSAIVATAANATEPSSKTTSSGSGSGITRRSSLSPRKGQLRSNRRKSVQFSDVTVSEHRRILGDNVPSTGGAPISIDWKPTYTHKHSVDEYENETASHSSDPGCSSGGGSSSGSDVPGRRKSKDEFKLTPQERNELLYSIGYTKQEVRRASMKADTKREQRQWTKDTPDMQPVEEILEKGLRALKKPFLSKAAIANKQRMASFCKNDKNAGSGAATSRTSTPDIRRPPNVGSDLKAGGPDEQQQSRRMGRRHSAPWNWNKKT